jgi:type II secretory pathway component PulF
MNDRASDQPVRVFALHAVIHAGLWIAFVVEMLYVAPLLKNRFNDFNDFDMTLPWLTRQFLAVSDWVNTYWYVVILGPVLWDAAALAVLYWLRVGRPVRVGYSAVVIFCLLVFLFWGALSFVLSLDKILEALSH